MSHEACCWMHMHCLSTTSSSSALLRLESTEPKGLMHGTVEMDFFVCCIALGEEFTDEFTAL